MKYLWLIFAPVLAFGQFAIPTATGLHSNGGVANNVAIVSGHLGGNITNNGTSVAFTFAGATITTGNTVLCGVPYFNGGAFSFTAGMLTKTAGTSTIGTIALDQSIGGGSATTGVALYRVPITGTGTLTLTFSSGTGYMVLGCAEFSGVNATPLSTTNTASGASGTLHSTGSVVTTDVGVMMYVGSEQASADFTRSWSDVIVYHVDTGATTFTGIVQYKIINASPNTLQDCTGATPVLPGGACNVGGNSSAWDLAYALYKTT